MGEQLKEIPQLDSVKTPRVEGHVLLSQIQEKLNAHPGPKTKEELEDSINKVREEHISPIGWMKMVDDDESVALLEKKRNDEINAIEDIYKEYLELEHRKRNIENLVSREERFE